MYDDVIYRIEWTTVVTVDDGVGFIRRCCGHINDRTGDCHVALLTEYQSPIGMVGSTIEIHGGLGSLGRIETFNLPGRGDVEFVQGD